MPRRFPPRRRRRFSASLATVRLVLLRLVLVRIMVLRMAIPWLFMLLVLLLLPLLFLLGLIHDDRCISKRNLFPSRFGADVHWRMLHRCAFASVLIRRTPRLICHVLQFAFASLVYKVSKVV